MDIDVNVCGVNVEIYKIRYVRTSRHQSFVGLLDGLVEIGVAHEAAVDEEILVGTCLTGSLRFGGKTLDATHRSLYVDR